MSREEKNIKIIDVVVVAVAWGIALLMVYAVFLKFRIFFH
jgi:hypothetical protein